MDPKPSIKRPDDFKAEPNPIMDKIIEQEGTQKTLAKEAETDGGKKFETNDVLVEEKAKKEEKIRSTKDKILGFFGQSEKQKEAKMKKTREEGLAIIMAHPTKRGQYQKMGEDMKRQFEEFVGNDPNVKYYKYDEKKKKFLDNSVGGFNV